MISVTDKTNSVPNHNCPVTLWFNGSYGGNWTFQTQNTSDPRQFGLHLNQTSRLSRGYSPAGVCVHTFPAGLLQLCASRSARCTTELLQRVLNAAARLVLNLGLHEHITPALQQLHWLPIDYRITYKLWLIMHLVHTSRAPQYLSDCVQTVACSSHRTGLRSSDTAAYVKPRCRMEPSSVRADSVMLDPLLGTVFRTTFTKSMTLVFLSVA